jgi:hypothetical protein
MRRLCIEKCECLDNPLFGSDVSQRRSWLLATLTRIKRLESIWIAGYVSGEVDHMPGNPDPADKRPCTGFVGVSQVARQNGPARNLRGPLLCLLPAEKFNGASEPNCLNAALVRTVRQSLPLLCY